MTSRKRGFPAALFDMSDMRLLHDETRYEGSVEYLKRILNEFMPTRNYSVIKYNLNQWSRIGFSARERALLGPRLGTYILFFYFLGYPLTAFAIVVGYYQGIFAALFTMVSVNIVIYVNEFVWRERDLDGYVRRLPLSAYDLKERLEDRLEEQGYSFEEVEVRGHDIYEKPVLLIIRHGEVVLLLAIWDYKEQAIVHIGRNPCNDWTEIGALRELVDGLDITSPIVREYDYLEHHH